MVSHGEGKVGNISVGLLVVGGHEQGGPPLTVHGGRIRSVGQKQLHEAAVPTGNSDVEGGGPV